MLDSEDEPDYDKGPEAKQFTVAKLLVTDPSMKKVLRRWKGWEVHYLTW